MLSIFLLSFIQSITEFLPISSSGHLYLLGKFGITEQGIGLDVLLHLGTLLAVIGYFWSDLMGILKSLYLGEKCRLFYQLLIATIPIIVVGSCAFNFVHYFGRGLYFVAFNSLFWGIVLWIMDAVQSNKRIISQLSYRGAFLIGCAQVLSLIPGTSRSGITMTAGRWLGLKRDESARFSMLLSIPTILAAVIYIIYQGINGTVQLPTLSVGLSAIGLTTLFGFIAIWFLMNWVKKSSFALFAIYRILLGLGILLYLFIIG